MKKFIFIATVLFLSISQVTFAQSLAERRAIKSYQESVLPDLQNQINSAVGFEIPLNIDWEKIALPGGAENYSNDSYFTNIFFTPLIEAFTTIGSDDLGKEALKAGLNSINITYDPDTAPASNYKNGVSVENNELTLNFAPFSNAADVTQRAEAIVEVLETKL